MFTFLLVNNKDIQEEHSNSSSPNNKNKNNNNDKKAAFVIYSTYNQEQKIKSCSSWPKIYLQPTYKKGRPAGFFKPGLFITFFALI